MSTTLNVPIRWKDRSAGNTLSLKAENKRVSFFAAQAKYVTAWFLVSMIIQGVFFLPLPALLIFNFAAPIYILVITLGLFFANLIAGMSSSGIRTIVYLFAASVVVHLGLLLVYTL